MRRWSAKTATEKACFAPWQSACEMLQNRSLILTPAPRWASTKMLYVFFNPPNNPPREADHQGRKKSWGSARRTHQPASPEYSQRADWFFDAIRR
jgi:hypothetical protein